MDKKKKALLITAGIAAVLLAAALLLSRPQPLGELLHTADPGDLLPRRHRSDRKRRNERRVRLYCRA